MDGSKFHAVILASPGLGHLIPILALSQRLLTHHAICSTVLVVTTPASPSPSKLLHHKLTHIVQLPPVDISGVVDPAATVVTQIAVTMREARPAIRSAISAMTTRPNLLIVDIFGTEAFDIADQFDMPKYVYCTSTAWFLALTMYCPILHKEVRVQYVDMKEPLRLPGCKPVRPADVVDPMLDRNDQAYHEYLRIGVEFSLSDGILLNTWEDLERTTLSALRENETLRSVVKVPVYPIGPLKRLTESSSGSPSELMEWLDAQPSESVIYVSFGSGGTLSTHQITELAWGLELSQQRFIWVLRPPTEGCADGSFFSVTNGHDVTSDYLPDGFLTRTRKVGVVVPLWAPQMEILNHPSVGGFLSHCGWNSSIESITSGVPMVAWPLYSEQKMNATMLTEEAGVAVRAEVVGREEIEEAVRRVMEGGEGKGMRKRVGDLKNSGEKALQEEGSSYNSLCQVIKACEMKLQQSKD